AVFLVKHLVGIALEALQWVMTLMLVFMYDLSSPISACPLQVVQLAEDLKLALELQPSPEERDSLRAQLPTETAQALIDWLQNGTVNLCSPANYETYQERLLRLEGDKESLVLQVSVLTDQVEAQGEKIRDLESSLEEHRLKLVSTEEMLQQELMSRTSLESEKLDLMDELSSLKLKLVSMEETHNTLPQDPVDTKQNKAESVVNFISELQEQMCRFQEEISTRIQEKRALEEREAQQGEPRVSQTQGHSPELGLALKHLKSKVEELEGEKSQYERKLRATKVHFVFDRNKGLRFFSSLVFKSQNLCLVDEQDRRIEELTILLGQYRKMKEVMLDECILSDQSPLSSGVDSGQQSPVSPENRKGHRGIKKLWGKYVFEAILSTFTHTGLHGSHINNIFMFCLHVHIFHPVSSLFTGIHAFSFYVRNSIICVVPRIRRSQSGSPVQVHDPELGEFKRGGFRSTAGPRLARSGNTRDLKIPFSKWSTEQVCEWLEDIGLGQYSILGRHWVSSGQTLLSATPQDLEKEMAMKNPLHRKKLQLAVKAFSSKQPEQSAELDHIWVNRWLDDIGLPQYKDQFNEGRVDGQMLQYLTVNDLLFLKVTSQLHHLSIKCAIHVLHVNKFNPNCLKRRPSNESQFTPSEVVQWSNHRVMEWLRSVDLAEYAPNLRGSGVHGGLIMLEPRFNSDTLAMLLNIPPQKTLLRRHLTTNFNSLVGPQAQQEKREYTGAAGYTPLNITAKVKPKKLGFSNLTHLRRRRPDESTDYVCPIESSSPQSEQSVGNGVQMRPYAGFRGLSPILDREHDHPREQVGLDDSTADPSP
uniref:PPFIA binding protein 2b n=1 Tax=Mastacembelus armatus TaxID=205130 RepID=A0A7N8WZI6_9TELE